MKVVLYNTNLKRIKHKYQSPYDIISRLKWVFLKTALEDEFYQHKWLSK